jgi:hypothetical protein
MRRRLSLSLLIAPVLLVVVLLPACMDGTSAIDTRPAGPAGQDRAASASDHLAQLLTAPRPAGAVTGTPALADRPAPAPPPSGPPYKTGRSGHSPVVIPPPALPPGDGTVAAVGDSVLLGTKAYLPTTLGGWDLRLDAEVGRTLPDGLDVLRENEAGLGQAAIICLGHNYGGGGRAYGYFAQILALLERVQRVVVVTVAEFAPAQREVNTAIRALPGRYPNVVVADWDAVVEANPELLRDDRVHPTTAGEIALANLIAVLLGPARRDGRTVPPPHLLTVPAPEPPPAASPPGGDALPPSVAGTSVPGARAATSSTSPSVSTTSTSTPIPHAPVPTSISPTSAASSTTTVP